MRCVGSLAPVERGDDAPGRWSDWPSVRSDYLAEKPPVSLAIDVVSLSLASSSCSLHCTDSLREDARANERSQHKFYLDFLSDEILVYIACVCEESRA